MFLATRGNLVWLGMILSGAALGFYVFTSWPDTSPQVIRLPYGEVMPKTPRAATPAKQVVVVAAPVPPEAEPVVAQAAAAPEPEPERAPASTPPAEEAAVPAESAYELGAQPLPGMGQVAPAQTAKKSSAATPTQQAPAAEPAQAPEEPPMLEIIIGSAPPSGQE